MTVKIATILKRYLNLFFNTATGTTMTVISLEEHRNNCNPARDDRAGAVFHLPVAPHTVARTRFSPPTPPINTCLQIPQALELVKTVTKERKDTLSMVAITGPGDPLASPEITLEVIRQLRSRYPDLQIGIKTLGIGSDQLAGELAKAGLNYVEMEVNGVRAEVLQKLYAWIRPGQKTLKIGDAVNHLIKEQRHGVPALKFHDIKVVVAATLYPGHNVDHIPKISSEMLELGADALVLTPYIPEPGVEVELEPPSTEMMAAAAEKAARHLPLVQPLLLQINEEATNFLGSVLPKPTTQRPNVAVVSTDGIEVNLHLGHASKVLIYGPRDDGLACLLEVRDTPPAGTGGKRWQEFGQLLSDCFVLLTASAGESPRKVLNEAGITVLVTDDNIEGTVDALYGGGKKGKKNSKK